LYGLSRRASDQPVQRPPQPPAFAPVATVIGGIDTAAARAAGFKISGPDNLEVVEGIGPRIANLLHAAGIATLLDLAHTPVATLEDLLRRGGTRFELAHPGTWPEQAALAANNRWHDLRVLQDELVGGVRRPDAGGSA